MKKKITASCLSLALVLGMFSTTALAAEEPNEAADTGEAIVQSQEVAEPTPAAEESGATEVVVTPNQANYTINSPTKLIVRGDVALTGTGDAFTINADTILVFEDGATLTLSGYTNGFVVTGAEGAPVILSSEDMDINATSEMNVFQLGSYSELSLSGTNVLQGIGQTGVNNRGIFLPSSSVDQKVTLEDGATLKANGFYRGMETYGAKNYVISGAGMDSSVFDFSNNDCGIALSYWDENANYEDCKLEVSNCKTSGIYMRQDNAAIRGLHFKGVDINCVNQTTVPSDIAIRFHTGPFTMVDSKVTIDGANTTGLWIYDGWDADRTGSKIENCDITVKNVEGNALQYNGKAITMAICHDWIIDGSTINVDNCGYAGINLSNDTRVSGSILGGYTAVPGMVGGKLIITDSDVHSSNMLEIDPSDRSASALFTVQVGQFLEFGDDVTVYNDNDTLPIVMCAKGSDKYPHFAGGFLPVSVEYDLSNLAPELNTDSRFIMTGGSSKDFATHEYAVARNKPVDENGTVLSMVTLTEEQYNNLKNDDGTLTVTVDGEFYAYYHASRAADDGNRYIWVPAGAVIGGGV